MHIGILQFEVLIDSSEGLKDKRRVLKSLKDRLHREHLVSVAEVRAMETWNLGIMGVAIVNRDAGYCRSVLDAIVDKLRTMHDARLGDFRIEVFGEGDLTKFEDEQGKPLWTPQERRDNDERMNQNPDEHSAD